MLSSRDPETINSLRLLKQTIESRIRPIVIWIGAGSSRWLGYPSWKDLARSLRRDFSRYVTGFDNTHASALVGSGRFPELFQYCKDIDTAKYHAFLAQSFLPRPDTNEYNRFIFLLAKLAPNYLVTTNVDEALENRLKGVAVLQRSNLSRCIELLQKEVPFLGKLHGSTSAVEGAVFAANDYKMLVKEAGYVQCMKYLFTCCTVIFLGYGASDDYVLNLLVQNSEEMGLFGAGPHFIVTSEKNKVLAATHRICYELGRYRDHRSAMTILDFVWQSTQAVDERKSAVFVSNLQEQPVQTSSAPTIYYISDFIPAGTWATSATVKLAKPTGEEGDFTQAGEFTLGLGFTNDELPFAESTALHDLLVGLICFDYVYLPLFAAGPAHSSLQADRFWRLIDSDCLRFIHMEHEPAAVFTEGELFGRVDLVAIGGVDNASRRSPSEIIRHQIRPVSGKEAEAEVLFSKLENKTITFRDGLRLEVPSLVRNSLLMPNVASLLGIGDAIVPSQLPKWLTFPYLMNGTPCPYWNCL
jgi:hypothetical protein